MTIKLTTNKALQAAKQADMAMSFLIQASKAESLAPVNVHSHGIAIQRSIDLLESSLELVKQFQKQVQER